MQDSASAHHKPDRTCGLLYRRLASSSESENFFPTRSVDRADKRVSEVPLQVGHYERCNEASGSRIDVNLDAQAFLLVLLFQKVVDLGYVLIFA